MLLEIIPNSPTQNKTNNFKDPAAWIKSNLIS